MLIIYSLSILLLSLGTEPRNVPLVTPKGQEQAIAFISERRSILQIISLSYPPHHTYKSSTSHILLLDIQTNQDSDLTSSSTNIEDSI